MGYSKKQMQMFDKLSISETWRNLSFTMMFDTENGDAVICGLDKKHKCLYTWLLDRLGEVKNEMTETAEVLRKQHWQTIREVYQF